MELSDLYIFQAIFEERNLSRTAERLGYVQSNVTARLRKLEQELGVSLFQRHQRGVVPTEKAEIFYQQIFDVTKRLEEAIMSVRSTTYPSGPLLLGVVETLATGDFMTRLSDYQVQFPDVELTLCTGSSQVLTTRVLNRELDGAFISGDVASKMLIHEFVHPEEIQLVTNFNRHPENLEKLTWVVFPKGCPYRAITEQWLTFEGVSSPKYLEISTLEMLLNCIYSGFGCSLLPKSVTNHMRIPLYTYQLPELFQYIQTGLIRRKDRFVSKAFDAFIETFRKDSMN